MNALANAVHQTVTDAQTNSTFSLTDLSEQEKEIFAQIGHLLTTPQQKLAQKLARLGVDAYWDGKPSNN